LLLHKFKSLYFKPATSDQPDWDACALRIWNLIITWFSFVMGILWGKFKTKCILRYFSKIFPGSEQCQYIVDFENWEKHHFLLYPWLKTNNKHGTELYILRLKTDYHIYSPPLHFPNLYLCNYHHYLCQLSYS
jgi:hypothetical protein